MNQTETLLSKLIGAKNDFLLKHAELEEQTRNFRGELDDLIALEVRQWGLLKEAQGLIKAIKIIREHRIEQNR